MRLEFTQPGNLVQNGTWKASTADRTMHAKIPTQFTSLSDARRKLKTWQDHDHAPYLVGLLVDTQDSLTRRRRCRHGEDSKVSLCLRLFVQICTDSKIKLSLYWLGKLTRQCSVTTNERQIQNGWNGLGGLGSDRAPNERKGTLQHANTVLEQLPQKFPPQANPATEHPAAARNSKSWSNKRTPNAEWLAATSGERGCHEIELSVIFALLFVHNLKPVVAFTSVADSPSFGKVTRCLNLP